MCIHPMLLETSGEIIFKSDIVFIVLIYMTNLNIKRKHLNHTPLNAIISMVSVLQITEEGTESFVEGEILRFKNHQVATLKKNTQGWQLCYKIFLRNYSFKSQIRMSDSQQYPLNDLSDNEEDIVVLSVAYICKKLLKRSRY